ncbi:hypothetical protein D0Y65_048285 [Glycine soja]|uniref:RNase H type-1 domain-containing protein n=1 Tax=Glycine soja TaxID=3848 RepID=A0A445FSB2_GLYSO|nr:hypothetical protein D0Y65_048285 [Glycine soja]
MVPLQVTDPGCGNSSYPKILNFSCGSLVISPCQLILFYFTAPFVFRFFLSQVWIGAQEESILQLDIIKQIDANDDSSTWIRHYAGSTHGGLFVVTCLILWKHRNARIFNNVVWENWFIISQIWNLQSIIRKFFVPKPSHVHDISARWIPPTSNFIKLNTDGSSLGNPDNVVFGCLLCDSLGQWISSYLGSCEIATCLFAELIAIYHGINIAWNKETTSAQKREEGAGRSCSEKTVGEMQGSFQPASIQEYNASLPYEYEDRTIVNSTSSIDAFNQLTTSDDQMDILLVEKLQAFLNPVSNQSLKFCCNLLLLGTNKI